MKKQVYSTPKTRLVTMSENVAIMAGSGSGSGSGSGTVINIGGNSGIGFGGGGIGPGYVHGYSGRFMDFN